MIALSTSGFPFFAFFHLSNINMLIVKYYHLLCARSWNKSRKKPVHKEQMSLPTSAVILRDPSSPTPSLLLPSKGPPAFCNSPHTSDHSVPLNLLCCKFSGTGSVVSSSTLAHSRGLIKCSSTALMRTPEACWSEPDPFSNSKRSLYWMRTQNIKLPGGW